MFTIEVDSSNRTVMLEPHGPLSKQDFEAVAKRIDPMIEQTGGLNGILIHTKQFPGWDSFAAMVAHFKFVKGHHKQVKKIALCTDFIGGSIAESLSQHFTSADIKHFPYVDLKAAKEWLNHVD